jgi:aspartyl-tRNA(Asn)/glutamyl-tRNA(Gln) amidotransferase subunit C
MAFTEKEIKHLAKLSRLKLSAEDVKTYKGQLASILKYVEKLQEVDTKGVPELAHGVGTTNTFREDVVEGCEADVQERIKKEFPRRQEDLLEVQAVFEGRTE